MWIVFSAPFANLLEIVPLKCEAAFKVAKHVIHARVFEARPIIGDQRCAGGVAAHTCGTQNYGAAQRFW